MTKTRVKTNYKKFLLASPIILVMLAIIINPSRYIASSLNGLMVFANNVLPALFPFFFFTKLLTSIGMAESIGNLLKKPCQLLYKTPPISGYILIMSVLSGYPIGARLLSDLYLNNRLTTAEVKRIMSFTSVSGPLFIIGTIGSGILKCPTLGYIIFTSNLIGALLNGFIYRNIKDKDNSSTDIFNPMLSDDNILENAITSSITSILIVGGYIVIFYILADVLYDIGVLKILSNFFGIFASCIDTQILNGISLSLIEMTKGIINISQSSNTIVKVATISGLISLGGLCVTLQSITYLKKAKIKVSYYLTTKLTQSILTTIITYILLLLMGY